MNIESRAHDATGTFVWDDPFLLDGQLSEDERMMRDAAAAFAAEKLAPRVQQAYLDEQTDPA
jgi:glutaryl-CoA dehydrogenase